MMIALIIRARDEWLSSHRMMMMMMMISVAIYPMQTMLVVAFALTSMVAF
jgi:hypothetical protein